MSAMALIAAISGSILAARGLFRDDDGVAFRLDARIRYRPRN
jgi:hypothetical protein